MMKHKDILLLALNISLLLVSFWVLRNARDVYCFWYNLDYAPSELAVGYVHPSYLSLQIFSLVFTILLSLVLISKIKKIY